MKRTFLAALAALTISASAFAVTAASAQNNQQPSQTAGQWEADQQVMLDAKLAGIKVGLQLTPDQEKLWGPFESAVKDAAKARMEGMQQMMQAHEQGAPMSPIDHLDAIADRLSRGAEDVRKIADAAKPLYANLDDSQKRRFGMLSRMLAPDHGRGAEMMRRQTDEGDNNE